jgi:hypothetical protein
VNPRCRFVRTYATNAEPTKPTGYQGLTVPLPLDELDDPLYEYHPATPRMTVQASWTRPRLTKQKTISRETLALILTRQACVNPFAGVETLLVFGRPGARRVYNFVDGRTKK